MQFAMRYNLDAIQKVSECGRGFRQGSLCARYVMICALVASIAGTSVLSGCSKPSEPEQPSTQVKKAPQAPPPEQAPPQENEEEKAWAEATRAGTVAAFTEYLQNHGSGTHAAEARERRSALEEQARKAVEEQAWAEASTAGTVAALT